MEVGPRRRRCSHLLHHRRLLLGQQPMPRHRHAIGEKRKTSGSGGRAPVVGRSPPASTQEPDGPHFCRPLGRDTFSSPQIHGRGGILAGQEGRRRCRSKVVWEMSGTRTMRRSSWLLALMSIGMVFLATTAVAAQDWPQWQGANRDGKSVETGFLKTWPAEGLNSFGGLEIWGKDMPVFPLSGTASMQWAV